MRRNTEDSFWAKVEKTEGCWLWTGARFQRGAGPTRVLTYGQFYYGNHLGPAHRFAWEVTHGPIPDGLLVCHHCDVMHCVRPEHLFLGTHADNSHDMVLKGRSTTGDRNGARLHPERMARGSRNGARLHPDTRARGERHGSRTHPERLRRGDSHPGSRLTDEKVRAIRLGLAGGLTHRHLAVAFGVSRTTITNIARGKTWRHVT